MTSDESSRVVVVVGLHTSPLILFFVLENGNEMKWNGDFDPDDERNRNTYTSQHIVEVEFKNLWTQKGYPFVNSTRVLVERWWLF